MKPHATAACHCGQAFVNPNDPAWDICDICHKKTHHPKRRKDTVYCPKCFKAWLQEIIELVRRA